MRGPKPAELTLSKVGRKELEALVRRHSTSQHLARRAQMILAAAEGKRNGQITRELGASVDTVRSWRMRWLSLQAVSLSDLSVSERHANAWPADRSQSRLADAPAGEPPGTPSRSLLRFPPAVHPPAESTNSGSDAA